MKKSSEKNTNSPFKGWSKESDQVKKAFELAEKAHKGQTRKNYSKDGKLIPYISHPIAVKNIAEKIAKLYLTRAYEGDSYDNKIYITNVSEYNQVINVVNKEHKKLKEHILQLVKITSLLHDSVEDSFENCKLFRIPEKDIMTLEKVEKFFGVQIRGIIDNLTHREEEEYDHSIKRATLHVVSTIVKAADNIHNMSDLNILPVHYHRRRTYRVSCMYLLEHLNIDCKEFL